MSFGFYSILKAKIMIFRPGTFEESLKGERFKVLKIQLKFD